MDKDRGSRNASRFLCTRIHFTRRAATNHKDEFNQMTLWLERKEKILDHDQHIAWRLAGCPRPPLIQWRPPGLDLHRHLQLSSNPTIRVSINELPDLYGAQHFVNALQCFVSIQNHPEIRTSAQLERVLWEVRIPFRKLPVWHQIKFTCKDPVTGAISTVDSIHARPSRNDNLNRPVSGRFDTALANEGNPESTGIHRKC